MGLDIRVAREGLSWTRNKLAEMSGLHPNSVRYWESKACLPRLEAYGVRKIRAAFLSVGLDVGIAPASPTPTTAPLTRSCRPD
jgi:transcriptional regulator with XRE-family HTH domain